MSECTCCSCAKRIRELEEQLAVYKRLRKRDEKNRENFGYVHNNYGELIDAIEELANLAVGHSAIYDETNSAN